MKTQNATPVNLCHIVRFMSPDERFTGAVSCEPMREVEMDGSCQLSSEHCEPEEAEFWGVYVQIKRNDRGDIWLEFQWVEDFYNEKDAKVFSEELGGYIRTNFELATWKEIQK